MGKRVSPAVIGAFVIASFAILLVALIVVGSGKMFRRPVTESLLTRLLYIDLDLHPKTPANYVLEPGGPYREIPTVQTDLQRFQERLTHTLDKFDQIDFQALVVSITDAANSIKSLASSPELKATLESLKGTFANLNQALTSAHTSRTPMRRSVRWSRIFARAPTKPTR